MFFVGWTKKPTKIQLYFQNWLVSGLKTYSGEKKMWERLSDFEPKRLNFDNENCDEVYQVFGQTFEFDNDKNRIYLS